MTSITGSDILNNIACQLNMRNLNSLWHKNLHKHLSHSFSILARKIVQMGAIIIKSNWKLFLDGEGKFFIFYDKEL